MSVSHVPFAYFIVSWLSHRGCMPHRICSACTAETRSAVVAWPASAATSPWRGGRSKAEWRRHGTARAWAGNREAAEVVLCATDFFFGHRLEEGKEEGGRTRSESEYTEHEDTGTRGKKI